MNSDTTKTPQPPVDEGGAKRPAKAGMGRAWLLFGALFLGGVILQHIMGGKAINGAGGERIPFVVAGLSAFILTMAAGWHKPWMRFLSSNRFSVPALFVLTILSVLGTLILQSQPERAIDAAYGSAANLIKGLFLDDVFHSIGFSLILGCGAGGLGLVLVRKRKLNLRYLGAVGAHLGLLLILAGAALGNVWVVKGRLNMHVGQRADAFAVPTADGKIMRYPLGFQISLDEFKLDMYEPDYRLMVFELSGDRERRITSVDPAKKEEWSQLASQGVEVLAYYPDHTREQVVEAVDGAGPVSNEAPAALGLLVGPDEKQRPTWLFDTGQPAGGQTRVGGQRLHFIWDTARAESLLASLAAPAKAGPVHTIVIGEDRLAVEPGRTIPLPGGQQTLTVTRTFADFIIDAETKKPSNRSDKPNNPAVEVVVSDGAGQEITRKYLFAKFPAFAHQGQDSPLASMRYEYSGGKGQARPNWIAVGQSKELWHVVAGAVADKQALAAGGQLTLGRVAVQVKDLLAKAKRSARDSTRSDKPHNPLVQLKLRGRMQELAPKMPLRLSRTLVLALAPKGGETVRDYLSTVSVWEDGKKVLTETVEVNFPLEYKGFVFYQSDYRPEDPTFSGFQVVRDSGLWLVYLGLLLNMIGVLTAMFLPVFSARKKKRAASEEGAAS